MDTKVMTILANRVNKNIAYLYVITYYKGSKHTLLVLLSHGYGGANKIIRRDTLLARKNSITSQQISITH